MNTEDPWLAGARAGREDAWAALHREHYQKLWSSVNRMINNPTLTDDIVQETFLTAFKEIQRFKGDSQIGTWLYRIAINKALDGMRKQKRTERWLSFLSPVQEEDAPPLPEAVVEPEVSDRLEAEELGQRIQNAMAELSPEHRAVVQLRLIDEMSLAETAALLKCKPGTVNSRLHYACEYLRRKLRTKEPVV